MIFNVIPFSGEAQPIPVAVEVTSVPKPITNLEIKRNHVSEPSGQLFDDQLFNFFVSRMLQIHITALSIGERHDECVRETLVQPFGTLVGSRTDVDNSRNLLLEVVERFEDFRD
jgi:hypothetical protein